MQPQRRYTSAEKRNFRLKPQNHLQCRITDQLFPGQHFLDLSTEDQKVIAQLIEEQIQENNQRSKQFKQQQKVARREEASQQQKRMRMARLLGPNLQSRVAVPAPRSWCRGFAPKLSFEERVLERLEHMDRTTRKIFHRVFTRLHQSEPVFKDSIVNTRPKVYEIEAGYGYRIYFRIRRSNIVVVLVGHKSTQRRDCDFLARNAWTGRTSRAA